MLRPGYLQLGAIYHYAEQKAFIHFRLTYFNSIALALNNKVNIALPALMKKLVELLLQQVV
jgi:hypothetical protein